MTPSLKEIARIENLELSFNLGTKKHPKHKKVIQKTSLEVYEGEILAIIGESGSGKSVLTSTLSGLNANSQIITHGKIWLNSEDVTNYDNKQWSNSRLRGKIVSQVFQNPLSTLNPTKKIGQQILDGILVNHEDLSENEAKEMVLDLLQKVRIKNPGEIVNLYPHQLSGGMVQRVVIVAIIALKPKLIIFDEPTTALDSSVQAEIIEIIRDINKDYNITIIFISHDLGVVASIANRIAIMYSGRIIEKGTVKEILFNSKHPYTWGLLMSLPELYVNSKKQKLYFIPGSTPTNLSEIQGDPFYLRNKHALKLDKFLFPPKYKISNTHYVWSWLYSKDAPKVELPKEIYERKTKWK